MIITHSEKDRLFMKNKRKIINRKINDHIERKMVNEIKDRGNTNYMYIRSRIYIPIINRIRQIVDFNNFLKF